MTLKYSIPGYQFADARRFRCFASNCNRSMKKRLNLLITLGLVSLIAVVSLRTIDQDTELTADTVAPFPDVAGAHVYRESCRHSYYDSDREEYLELAEGSAERYFLRGLAYHARLRLKLAETNLLKASELAPDSESIHLHLAEIQRLSGKLDSALASANHVLELNPDFYQALGERSVILRRLGREAESELDWAAYRTVIPAEYHEYNHLVYLLNERGEHEEAWRVANLGLEEHQGSTIIHVNRAIAMTALGYGEAALADLDYAIGDPEEEFVEWANWYEARIEASQLLGLDVAEDRKRIEKLQAEFVP